MMCATYSSLPHHSSTHYHFFYHFHHSDPQVERTYRSQFMAQWRNMGLISWCTRQSVYVLMGAAIHYPNIPSLFAGRHMVSAG